MEKSHSSGGSADSHELRSLMSSKSNSPNQLELELEDDSREWSPSVGVKNRKRSGIKLILLFGIICISLGYLIGKFGNNVVKTVTQRVIKTTTLSKKRCDPYVLPGVLFTNSTEKAANRWEVIDPDLAPDGQGCPVGDYMSALSLSWEHESLDFAINKTIIILGDSIDRYNLVDFCQLLGGEGSIETLMTNHPLSPPLPKGRSGPTSYHDKIGGEEGAWSDYEQSRPHICHVKKYDLLLMNVFHYGLQQEDLAIMEWSHFYPPATIEDRLDQIVLPILASLAERSEPGSAPRVPDIISITPGFWTLARQVLEDDKIRNELVAQNVSIHYLHHLDDEADMNETRQKEMPIRMVEVLQHIADAWIPTEARSWVPTIVWRTLHHPKSQHLIPLTRARHYDQIGRRVIEKLKAPNSHYAEEVTSKERQLKIERGEWYEENLGDRIIVDTWGSLLLGQENHFRDAVHPAALPGSWLYGNMLMDKLRRVVDERKS